MLKAIDNYYFALPEPQQSCLLFLRHFLLEHSPNISEHYKFSTAFFYFKTEHLCYFSVSKSTGKTYIGFVQGYRFSHPKLLSEGRKQIKVLYLDPSKDVDVKTLKEVLKLALR
ncbi:MAG: DUF1801 domain-containing protein [bacterium]|nr:DUF1801 domain-containing protein [bacterium]